MKIYSITLVIFRIKVFDVQFGADWMVECERVKDWNCDEPDAFVAVENIVSGFKATTAAAPPLKKNTVLIF